MGAGAQRTRAALLAALGYAALQVLGRRAGSTAAERRAHLPGDDVVAEPQLVTDHAVTLRGRPADVWPWLTQMGWHRGGWYTPRWVDRLLFPANRPSLDHLDPTLVRPLVAGDVIPDGQPGTAFFVVETADAPHALVLHSTTHVPSSWRRHGAAIDWTWCFHLTGGGDGRTRLHLRVRGRLSPWWLAVGYTVTLVPADLVMARGMLRGIKRRVELQPAAGHGMPGTPDPGVRTGIGVSRSCDPTT
jgi:hypothetical protein